MSTRPKRLASKKRYREANGEKISEAQRAWREKNRKKRLAYSRAWYRANRKKELAKAKARRAAHPNYMTEYGRSYYAANSEDINARRRAARRKRGVKWRQRKAACTSTRTTAENGRVAPARGRRRSAAPACAMPASRKR